jgi:hypothetical protein
MTPLTRSAQFHDLTNETRPARQTAGPAFSWSRSKLRFASLLLLGAATPAAIGFALSGPVGKWFCLAWLLVVAVLMHSLSRRAVAETFVLSIDQRGILDRRLMSRHIAWQEIAAVCAVDTNRSHVVDLKLRWPDITLAETRWPVRVGAHCQRGYGVPAVTISVLLLEGNVSEVLNAVALYRPDLLHDSNRRQISRDQPDGGDRRQA